jgi:hypothetical protein
MIIRTVAAAVALSACAAPAGLAQQQPEGCADYETHGQFDFWVGEWNVYARNGDFAGRNTISKRSGGCLLLEEWRSAGGGDGTSMNYVDPATGDWRQVWMGVNNYIDYSGGLTEAGQMMLEGEITYFSNESSRTADFRGVWTPLENGHVIQHFQQYDAEEEVWNDWFVGRYVPADEDRNGENPDNDATAAPIETPPEF